MSETDNGETTIARLFSDASPRESEFARIARAVRRGRWKDARKFIRECFQCTPEEVEFLLDATTKRERGVDYTLSPTTLSEVKVLHFEHPLAVPAQYVCRKGSFIGSLHKLKDGTFLMNGEEVDPKRIDQVWVAT